MSGSGSGGSGSGYNGNVNSFATSSSLNGSSAPNNSTLPLSTPVNTSSGNGGSSGTNLASVLSGLSGLGTSAGEAYQLFTGQQAQPQVVYTTSPSGVLGYFKSSSGKSYLGWVIGGVVLLVLILLLRKK